MLLLCSARLTTYRLKVVRSLSVQKLSTVARLFGEMEIYRHQVGGHSRLLKPQDSSKVFKPYSESEHRFYERLVGLGATSTDSGPLHVLKQFVPKYFGLTEVQVQTTMLPASSSGGRSFSLQSTSKVSSDAQKLLLGSSPLVCQRGNGENSFLPEKVVKNTSLCDQACPRFNAEGFSSMSLDAENPPTRLGAAGGSLAVDADIAGRKNGYLKALPAEERPAASAKSVMTASSSSTHTLKYIVLEDLVYMYKKPCVMDIKMGKRQRKIGASPEKEQRQIEKSLKTTSHALGFRLCGCQVSTTWFRFAVAKLFFPSSRCFGFFEKAKKLKIRSLRGWASIVDIRTCVESSDLFDFFKKKFGGLRSCAVYKLHKLVTVIARDRN